MPVREILRPMLASLSEAPLTDADWVYEPKYDGIRAIAEVAAPSARSADVSGRGAKASDRSAKASAERSSVHLWSRLGNEKTTQFPEIADALRAWARRLNAPVILDGEIVALDPKGNPTGFQQLQGRIHVLDGGPDRSARSRSSRASSTEESAGTTHTTQARVAYIVFDLLEDGSGDLRGHPLRERRAALEGLFAKTGTPLLRISDQVAADGRALYEHAMERGWEGLIAKLAASPYKSGKRTPDWRKLKIVQEQEFVVGGWTEPRHSREYFGALLLGVYPGKDESPSTNHSKSPITNPKSLVYAGHTGTGFNETELARVMKLLRPLETRACPFSERPKTNERPHWVEPKLVAQIKFTEWTADNKLRHPVYLGLRDDKKPEDVHREISTRLNRQTTSRLDVAGGLSGPAKRRDESAAPRQLIEQLRAIEDSRRDGTLTLPGGDTFAVSNLHKIFWPAQKLTKGDLMRYYVHVADCILPAVDGRPLVMKRLPNGIAGKAFYQQRAPEDVPDGVRVEKVEGDSEVPSRIIGGSLKTLLYMTQLAAISQDPWFSRVDTPADADHVALDLDPADGVGFAQVLEVARWIHEELEWLGTPGFPKTSGADGLHIYIPLPPGTPYDAGLLFCQIVATVVAQKHRREATVERAVRARGKRVYIDYLQNIRGKTLATAYSARASDYAGASTPVSWQEVHDGFDREDFSIVTLPDRIRKVGDLWEGVRSSKGANLSRVSRYTESSRR